jgi:hypothetical protein
VRGEERLDSLNAYAGGGLVVDRWLGAMASDEAGGAASDCRLLAVDLLSTGAARGAETAAAVRLGGANALAAGAADDGGRALSAFFATGSGAGTGRAVDRSRFLLLVAKLNSVGCVKEVLEASQPL